LAKFLALLARSTKFKTYLGLVISWCKLPVRTMKDVAGGVSSGDPDDGVVLSRARLRDITKAGGQVCPSDRGRLIRCPGEA
jgi:hypothetical protein